MVAIIAAVLIEILMLVLVGMGAGVIGTILVLLLAHAIYLVAVHYVLKNGCRQLIIIAVALVFRITLAPLPSPFSHDVNRYRWEALVQEQGGNPYNARPADSEWAHLRDSTYADIPAKDFKAGYGPAWELVSYWTLKIVRLWSARPETQLLWWKAPAALFDLGTIAALIALLRSRGFPDSRVLIYAWAPLPVWEFWGNGHNDAMVVFFVVAALALHARRAWASEAMLGVAIAVKWWPAILLPAFVWRARSIRPLVSAAAVVACFAVHYLTNVTENAQFMSGFVGGWRNNDSLFGLLLYLTGDLYRAKYLAFALLCGVAVWLACRDWPLESVALWMTVALLLLSANCHPWYLTWIIPLLALYPHPPLLLWMSLTPFAYSVLIRWDVLGVWDGSTPDRWWIYGPVFAWFGWDAGRRWFWSRRCGSLVSWPK
jgi:alpha-1,6-mannosyltransferase